MLRTAENSVVVGFTATPLSDRPDDARGLLDVVKGHRAKELSDEGFVSFYMDSPAACFPAVHPRGVPRSLPAATVRPVVLRNFGGAPKPAEWRRWSAAQQAEWRRRAWRGAAAGTIPTCCWRVRRRARRRRRRRA